MRLLGVVLVIILGFNLVACSTPPPRFGFYMSDDPWVEIPRAQEEFRGQIMWGADFPLSKAVVTELGRERFSVWVYSDPPTSKLTLHIALYSTELFSSKRTGNVTYSTWYLEPYNSQTLHCFSLEGSTSVKRFDFDLNNPELKGVVQEVGNAIPRTLVLNSNVLGIAFIKAP